MSELVPVDVVDRARVVEVERECCYACQVDRKSYVFAQLPPSDRFPEGTSVAYCYHHGTRFMGGLIESGAIIIDMRHVLEAEER